jgi:hypothetical protein
VVKAPFKVRAWVSVSAMLMFRFSAIGLELMLEVLLALGL